MAKKKKKAATKSKAKTTKKAGAKKASAAKTKAKKKVAKKTTSTKGIAKLASKVDKARSKSDVMSLLAETNELSKKQVSGVFESLADLIEIDLSKKGPGVFTVPGLMKITKVQKPATKARKGINPFTGEMTTFKAKPARSVVKVRALKGLKDMV